MQDLGLIKQLMNDTDQNVPPFAAASLKIARKMGREAVDILLKQIHVQEKISFLALEALRTADFDVYRSLPKKLCTNIYSQALRTSRFFNTWGVPGYQLTDTAKAFIGLGETSVAVLKLLLYDLREAPLTGSKTATVARVYNNRVCDYAFVFINEARHQQYSYPQNPADRDKMIKILQLELENLL